MLRCAGRWCGNYGQAGPQVGCVWLSDLADSLAAADRTLMIVGHLPFLDRLVSQLVFGDADRPIVQFEAAGLVGMQFQDGHWMITCVVDPELFPWGDLVASLCRKSPLTNHVELVPA